MKYKLMAAFVAALTLSAGALADGSIASGSVSIDYQTGSAVDSGNTTVYGVGTDDQLYSIHFLYRVGGDTQETTLGSPTSENYSGNTATLTWTNVDSRGLLDIVVTMALTSSEPGTASLGISMQTTNISGSSQTVDLFWYVDPDVDGSSSNDRGALAGANSIVVHEDTIWTFTGNSADAYQVTVYSDLADSLGDGAITNLDNTGLPFGPGDITLAFQWANRAIAPGGSLTISASASARPPGPVPTLPLPLLGLLSLLLGGAAWRARFSARQS